MSTIILNPFEIFGVSVIPISDLRIPLTLATTDAINYGDPVLLADDVIGSNDFSVILADSPTLETDSGNDYADFTSGNKYLTANLSKSFFNKSFSVMNIVKMNDGRNGNQALWGGRNSGSVDGTWMFIQNTGVLSVAYATNGINKISTTTNPIFSDGVNPEKNIIYTISESNGILIYADGSLVPASDGSITELMSTYDLDLDYSIGAYNLNGSETLFSDSLQRELQIFGKELTQLEVTQLQST